MKRWLVLMIFGHLVVSCHLAYARLDAIPGSRYTSGRGAALGDAFLPLGDDVASGLFYNPAALAKLKKFQIEPFNLSFYGDTGFLSNGTNSTKITQLSEYASTLLENPGTPAGLGGAFLFDFGVPAFSLGLLTQTEFFAVGNADGTLTYKSLFQFIPAFGSAFRLFRGVVRIGYSLQWVNEAVGNNTVTLASGPNFNSGLYQGGALSHNFGLALTFPIRYLPEFDIVARNVGSANYTSGSLISFTNNAVGAPPSELMSVDGSFSLHPQMGKGVLMNLVFEDRDMTNISGIPLMGHLAGGAELSFRGKFFLRGGWRGGYPSAGIGLKRKGGELNLIWYSEELGTTYLGLRDQRYMLQFQVKNF